MMNESELFPEQNLKKVYAYYESTYPDLLKIGETTRELEIREKELESSVVKPKTEIVKGMKWSNYAIREDGTIFSDKDLRDELANHFGCERNDGEWMKCNLDQVKAAYQNLKHRNHFSKVHTVDFPMRPEQKRAVEQTLEYYKKIEETEPGATPHFLWNAKMRFGKTFTAYQLAKKMGAKKVLVLTFKPAVESAWSTDLQQHVDFDEYQFYSSKMDRDISSFDLTKPIVCFGSFQDYLGKTESGGIKAKNEWVHSIVWDLVIIDEYHFGAWNDNAKSLLKSSDQDAKDAIKEQNEVLEEEGYDIDMGYRFDKDSLPIEGKHFLYLSGTPFRAITDGEFLEEQIFNWTYQDEQEAKHGWSSEPGHTEANNPYAELPMMVIMTYQMPNDLGRYIDQYDMNEFDLNEFFKAEGVGSKAKFKHENAVQKWLDILRGKIPIFNSLMPESEEPPLPYGDARLLNLTRNSMWFLSSVSSCDAMENMLRREVNRFFHDYAIINCSGNKAGIGLDALEPVKEHLKIDRPDTKSIILTCGKLTTGVTIKPLGGVFMLRNCSSPETYFQTAFRAQSPWTLTDETNHEKVIFKKTCYIFDFAPNRALKEIVSYANKLSLDSRSSAVDKVKKFINFLPILQFEGSGMHPMDASEILDFVDHGTTATLLAKRWNSATLVHVDNDTLNRVLKNPKAMEAIMKIEGFRALGDNVFQTIINRSKTIKKLKSKEKLTKEEKKQLTKEEKELRSLRLEVQRKLMQFQTRIPIFMYLTDEREEALIDVIKGQESRLFQRVTGLTQADFELLLSLGVFDEQKMNLAVLQFRRYEETSLSYLGINKHSKETRIGAWSTTVDSRYVKNVKGA